MLQRSSSDAPVRISASSTTSGPANTQVVGKVTTPLPAGAEGEPKVEIQMFHILDDCFHTTQHGEDDVVIQLGPKSNWKHFEYERRVDVPGFYHLYFSNCEPQTSVSWELEMTEYNVNADYESYNFIGVRWLKFDNEKDQDKFMASNASNVVYDHKKRLCFSVRSEWDLKLVMEKNPNAHFYKNSDYR